MMVMMSDTQGGGEEIFCRAMRVLVLLNKLLIKGGTIWLAGDPLRPMALRWTIPTRVS